MTLTANSIQISLLPSPQTTATFLLPPIAIPIDPDQQSPPSPSSPPTAIPFALAPLPASLSLPTSPSSASSPSTIAILIELEAPGSSDEEQPPRLLVTVDEQGNMVWPLEGSWWWWAAMGPGGAGWFPGAVDFGGGGRAGLEDKEERELK